VGTIDATVTATAAWLVTVMACDVELAPSVVAEKVRTEGERVGAAGVWPVPVREAVSVAGAAPAVVTVKIPVRIPVAVGVKMTEMAQVPLAGMLIPQVLVWL